MMGRTSPIPKEMNTVKNASHPCDIITGSGPEANDATCVKLVKDSTAVLSLATQQTTKIQAARRKVCNRSCLPLTDPGEFALTIPWSSFVHAKISVGIMTQPHRTDLKQMVQQKICLLSQRRNIVSFGAIWSLRVVVERCNEMPLSPCETNRIPCS